jgi:hypothetical protein
VPPRTPHACPDANPGRCGGKAATNRLSYGTTHDDDDDDYDDEIYQQPLSDFLI